MNKHDRPVTVEWLKPSSVQLDPDDDDNWVGIARWAQIMTRGGREFFRGQQVQANVSHRLTLPTAPGDPLLTQIDGGLSSAMRVRLGSRVLDVTAAFDVDERHTEIELQCVERT